MMLASRNAFRMQHFTCIYKSEICCDVSAILHMIYVRSCMTANWKWPRPRQSSVKTYSSSANVRYVNAVERERERDRETERTNFGVR